MISIQEITAVEDEYHGRNGKPSLGRALEMWKSRWESGERDRETALRIIFLLWYCCAEPGEFTGLPQSGISKKLLIDAFESLGGIKTTDAELCYVMGIMTEVAVFCFGDNEYWEKIGIELRPRTQKLKPDGFKPEHFRERGAYGDYFAHMAS